MQATDPDAGSVGTRAALGAAGLAAAAAIGWLASQESPLLAVVPVALPILLYLGVRPVLLLWCAIVGGLVVGGLAKLYVPQIQLVRWALAPIAVALALHAAAGAPRRPDAPPVPLPATLGWAAAFVAVALISSLASGLALERFAIGIKGYFQVWGLLIALAFVAWPAGLLDRLPRVLLAIALLQIPFVVHQLLFLVPMREGMGEGIVPIDIVAGTFGASLEGGGANAVLNAFLIVVLSGVLAAHRLKVLSSARLWPLAILLLLPVLSNEAKVSILYLLAAFAVLYGGDAARSPKRFFGAALAAGLLTTLLVWAYTLNSPSQSRVETWQDLLRYTYEYNVADREVHGELTRFGALEFWAKRHGLRDLEGTLLGHGVGFTRVGDSDGDLRRLVRAEDEGIPAPIDLGSNIGNTAVAALLWETGVIGLCCILGLLAAAYRAAGRLESVYGYLPERVAVLRAARVAMAVAFIGLGHKNVLVFDVAYQTFLMLTLGLVVYWERQASIAGLGRPARLRIRADLGRE